MYALPVVEMNEWQRWLEHYKQGVKSPQVSGFEVLELLDLCSHLAEVEKQMSADERMQLEQADREFLEQADAFYTSISEIADLAEMRIRAGALPSHWWWYLDELVRLAAAA